MYLKKKVVFVAKFEMCFCISDLVKYPNVLFFGYGVTNSNSKYPKWVKRNDYLTTKMFKIFMFHIHFF